MPCIIRALGLHIIRVFPFHPTVCHLTASASPALGTFFQLQAVPGFELHTE